MQVGRSEGLVCLPADCQRRAAHRLIQQLSQRRRHCIEVRYIEALKKRGKCTSEHISGHQRTFQRMDSQQATERMCREGRASARSREGSGGAKKSLLATTHWHERTCGYDRHDHDSCGHAMTHLACGQHHVQTHIVAHIYKHGMHETRARLHD